MIPRTEADSRRGRPDLRLFYPVYPTGEGNLKKVC